MSPEVIIFDVDGLMLDTETRWQQAWQEIGQKYNIHDLGTTTFLKCVGRNGEEVLKIVSEDLKHIKNPDVILQEARSYGRKLLEEHIDPKPGIYELLDTLDGLNIKKAVATSTDKDLTIKRLTKLNLIQHFDYLLCGDEVINRKPNPEIYEKVISYFDVKPQNALVLEDSVVGVEAAYRAGIPCIMIPDLIPPKDKQKKETVAILHSLHDVINLFD